MSDLTDSPPSAKIISILRSGDRVEMWHNDSEAEREHLRETQGREPVRIILRQAREGEGGEHTNFVQERVQDGETIMTEPIHQPGIDRLVKDRTWTVNEQGSPSRLSDLDRLAELISETTAARGVDAFAVEECGLSATEWAEKTGRDRSTVARNVRRASE